MEHTWESHYLKKIECVNATSGDVVVCSLSTKPDQVASELGCDRISFVAPLTSRSELDWLLRGLHLHPSVRHLVICGEDRKAMAGALVALFEAGLDESGRLPGSRGSLSPEFDRASVDTLREHIQVWDWRQESLADATKGIVELSSLPRVREAQRHADIPIPERKPFASRKTSFPIHTTDVGDGWLQLLNLVMRIGTQKTTSRGDLLAEALNAIVTIELAPEEEDLPSFLDFNSDDFDEYYRRFTSWSRSEEAHTNHPGGPPGRKGLDRIESAIGRLEQSLDTLEATAILLDSSEMDSSDEAPSILSATFNVVDRELFGSFVLRSTDVYTDWPLDALSLTRLQRETAARLGLGVGSATFVIHSAHLYDHDWDRSLQVLSSSFKRPLPLQVDPSGIFLFGNDDGEARAMLLDHDAGSIFWEGGFSDPEDLSWYIIDVMPWLLPQHMRYVGQECAALMRAIREGEDYVQG